MIQFIDKCLDFCIIVYIGKGLFMGYVNYLKCSYCGKRLEPNLIWNLCPVCGKPIIVIYNLKQLRKVLRRDDLLSRAPNIWRYQELLPIDDPDNILSLGEGYTPLIYTRELGRQFGFYNLFIKDEAQNPTGSFKARGLSVAVSKAKELGINELSMPSAGNAGVALSAYASMGGLKSYIYMSRDVPKTFVVECIARGANVQLVDGVITDCARVAHEDNIKYERFDISTLKEPYRIEGKKTMGLELAEQLGWELPDVIIYPTGGGTGLVGMWKAFEELQKLGWVNSKLPRMVAVQSRGCAPIVRAFNNKKKFAEPWPEPVTIAEGLRVPSAIGDFLILNSLRESKGTAVAVSDQEILRAIQTIAQTQGIFLCPEGAATFVAFRHLRDQGWIGDDERVVLFNTASGLKYMHLWLGKDLLLNINKKS